MRCVLLLVATAAMADRILIHPPQVVPDGWVRSDDACDVSGHMELLVGLRRSNSDQLEQVFWESSTPGGDNYLKHLAWHAMGEIVRPEEHAIAKVLGMLALHGAVDVRVAAHGDYIGASLPMREIEKMTSGTFAIFVQGTSGRRLPRLTGGVRLSVEMAEHVETLTGLHGFPLDSTRGGEESSSGVTPAVINKAYSIGDVTKSGSRNIQSIAQFQGQYVSPTDLSNFCKKYNPSGTDCAIEKFIGKNTAGSPGIESMLDVEYIMGVGQNTSTWVYSYPSVDFCSDLLQWANDVAGEADHPYVVSMSYGSQKIDFCDNSTRSRLGQDVQKLGAMGITVVIASGDDGSGGITRQGTNLGKLSPSFPASIPYALAVGSTTFVSAGSSTEQATTQFGSGGGFSYDYDMPSYQSSSVKAYLAKNPKTGTRKYAENGRGTPDVALLGEAFAVLVDGSYESVGGTSASTPTWGSIISLLNEECLSASGGKKTLGFVNPLFYQNPDAFTDITIGSNAIGSNKKSGWKCTEGWDAATGLGTPAFDKLQKVVRTACGSSSVTEDSLIV